MCIKTVNNVNFVIFLLFLMNLGEITVMHNLWLISLKLRIDLKKT